MTKHCLICNKDTSFQSDAIVVRLQFKRRARWTHSNCLSLCEKHEDYQSSFKMYLKDDYQLFTKLREKLK